MKVKAEKGKRFLGVALEKMPLKLKPLRLSGSFSLPVA